jgi:chemotaxis protein CheZ
LTRSLHDSLRALGYDKELESAAAAIPNARDRLSYVAQLTQQAADRVLNATDIAKPIQATLERDASGFDKRWDAMFEGKLDVEGFRCLAQETHAFLKDIPSRTKQTDAQLLEIVMAQDFQDLTGQVLKKVTTLVQDVEAKLLQLLLDHMPSATQEACADAGLEGPIVNANGRTDVVTNQAQVDDLLASLGF